MKNWETVDADEVRILSKHFSQGRGGHKVEFIGVHHNAGNLSIQQTYNVWQNRPASAHYQVDINGRIGQLVWDRDTAWALGNFNMNQRSINIEHANNTGAAGGWTISEATLENGAHLVAALCKAFNLGRPVWGQNVRPHSQICPTACPGAIGGAQRDAYMARAQYWYDQMTGSKPAPAPQPAPQPAPAVGYTVKVTTNVLNIRKGAGTNFATAGSVKKGEVYTIVAESAGQGASKWGKLKSGAGWISLDFVQKTSGGSAPAAPKPAPTGIAVDGFWGKATTRALQRHFGTTVDGIVSSQNAAIRSVNGGLASGWEWSNSPRGSILIKAMQRALKVKADGIIGPITINALIRHFQAQSGSKIADGKLDAKSITIKAMQRALNEGRF